MDVGDRATSGTVAEVETRLEQRSSRQSRGGNDGLICTVQLLVMLV